MAYLEIKDVEVYYGHVKGVENINLHVEEGEVVSLLGNNGAGKTTTLSAVSGLVRPRKGSIHFDGTDITTVRPWDLVERGVVHVPEGRRIFSTMTVLENLQLGGYRVKDTAAIRSRIDHVFDIMPILGERRGQEGGTLSGGEQQMLAIGRALVAGPKLLMLDEPSMGLAPLIVNQVLHIIREINESGTTVLLVEQNARGALRISDRGYVLENGKITLHGNSKELLADSTVIDAYLGAG